MSTGDSPKVFISYSHDSDEHADRVLALADKLRAHGIDCVMDQYFTDPPQGWPRWMDDELEKAGFVLVVFTETYQRRATGKEKPGIGRGVSFESILIVQDLYNAGMWNEKFVPVLMRPEDEAFIVRPLRPYSRYVIDDDAGFERLRRKLVDDPEVVMPPLGKVEKMGPKRGAANRPLNHAPGESLSNALDPKAKAPDEVVVSPIPNLRLRINPTRDGARQLAQISLLNLGERPLLIDTWFVVWSDRSLTETGDCVRGILPVRLQDHEAADLLVDISERPIAELSGIGVSDAEQRVCQASDRDLEGFVRTALLHEPVNPSGIDIVSCDESKPGDREALTTCTWLADPASKRHEKHHYAPPRYDVFLSHSSKDKNIVRPIAVRLKADGLRVWFDEWCIRPGDSIPSKIDEGLETSAVLVLCMSENAFGSDWAGLETQTVRFKDPLNRDRGFIPLLLDDTPIKGSLAQFMYIDWRRGYEEGAYQSLLDACRPGRAAGPGLPESEVPPNRARSAGVHAAPLIDAEGLRGTDIGPLGAGTLVDDRFRVVCLLGEGGMGVVYLVRDELLDRECALKVMHPRVVSTADARERFLREIKILEVLDHPGIVRAFDCGIDRELGCIYFTMTYIEGETLREHLDRRVLDGLLVVSPNQARAWAIALLETLAYAHDLVIHRDLHPSNIMVRKDGSFVILDFGLAKQRTTNHAELSMTAAAGTAYYMAPEQLHGNHRPTVGADLYSVGAMLYEWLTGRKPAGHFGPPSRFNPDVPQQLDEVVMKCLEADPEDRYPVARSVIAALRQDSEIPKQEADTGGSGLELNATKSRVSMATLRVAPGMETSRPAGTEETFDGMRFVWIPPGEFMMGSLKGEGREDQQPAHPVRITRGFWLGKYPVTQTQWNSVMGDNPSHFKGAQNPVERVSRKRCQEFLRKLGEEGGDHYCFPTEAEWEYACRAGSNAAYCFGADPGVLKDYAWFSENSKEKTHRVGGRKPNAWGLHDMHGNVWELCGDWFGGTYYDESPTNDPPGPSGGTYRVVRGGAYHCNAGDCRSAFRAVIHPVAWGLDVGFRVVRTP